MTALTCSGADFTCFSMLYLDRQGRFLDPESGDEEGPRQVQSDELPGFLRRSINRPNGVTDFFVWVHGWQNDELRAVSTAKRLFANLDDWFKRERTRYPKLAPLIPGYVAVHWPSTSMPGPFGYQKIRNRAKTMTTQGEAEFFLASLLGYLDEGNKRGHNRKVLRAKDGLYVHCLGHSFGGRFLTAAIRAGATPTERSRKLLAAHRETSFKFNVDSLCVLQMAAGAEAFGSEFSSLLGTGPLAGPIVLTHSTSDMALCIWHKVSEREVGIGCKGAISPADRIGSITLHPIDTPYSEADFSHDITNVDASHLFTEGGWAEGAHSDFWHTETLHLITSVVERVRS
jgi:hypothetical protein